MAALESELESSPTHQGSWAFGRAEELRIWGPVGNPRLWRPDSVEGGAALGGSRCHFPQSFPDASLFICFIYLFTLSGNNKGNLKKKKRRTTKQDRSQEVKSPGEEGLGKAKEREVGAATCPR